MYLQPDRSTLQCTSSRVGWAPSNTCSSRGRRVAPSDWYRGLDHNLLSQGFTACNRYKHTNTLTNLCFPSKTSGALHMSVPPKLLVKDLRPVLENLLKPKSASLAHTLLRSSSPSVLPQPVIWMRMFSGFKSPCTVEQIKYM